MKRRQQGFTLIEMTITVAIVGILAGIAIPAYRTYIGRSEAASALATIANLQTGVSEATVRGLQGVDLAGVGIANSAANPLGTIKLDYTADAEGFSQLTFSFGPGASPGTRNTYLILERFNTTGAWTCTGSMNADFRPKICGGSGSS